MSTLKKCYYRVFQWIFNIGARCLYWRRPIVTSGPNSVTKIPELLKERNVTKPIIVTGPSIGKKLAPRVTEALDAAGIPYFMFANVEANPSVNTVNTIQKLYFENKCDGFIAIGGGSPMDAAKGAAARVVRPRTPVGKMAGLLRVMRRIPPFIAVPTTAGTGSETTIAAVITDTDTHHNNDFEKSDVNQIEIEAHKNMIDRSRRYAEKNCLSSIPISRQFRIYFAISAGLPMTEVINAAMNSTG